MNNFLNKKVFNIPNRIYRRFPAATRGIIKLLHFLYPNSVSYNEFIWSRYDWSEKGEEWSNNPEWKKSFIEYILKPFIGHQNSVLEIGPGAGRWSEIILPLASNLTLVDIAPLCINMCKEKFGSGEKISYLVNNGSDLNDVPDNSIERIWSWAVFVHLESNVADTYLKEFFRVMKPGGKALLQHSKYGVNIGWRSDLTKEKMLKLCQKHGFYVEKQFNSWDNGRQHIWPSLPPESDPDIITIFSKPEK